MNSYNSFSELQSHSASYASTNVFSESFSRDEVTKEYYIWYDQTRIAAILDQNKQPKLIYLYGPESDHVPSYIVKDNKTYKIIHDPGTGSVRFIIDPTNTLILQELEYDEFGNMMKNTNPDFQPITYTGGLYDQDTKLLRLGARDYDPTIGRWTTKDPIGLAGGDTSLYAYVGGNPMSYVDPKGTDVEFFVGNLHYYLSVTDPKSRTGRQFIDFYPAEPLSFTSAIRGTVGISSEFEDFGLPYRTVKLTPQQDAVIIKRAKDIAKQAEVGNYKYKLIPSGGTNNCFSFKNQICSGICD